MASSDEDDLEALRLAALATLKQKQEAQEPQGIQVLSSLSVPNTNQYHQDGGGMHPDNYGYEDYGEVPFAFQQAVFNQQQRGRGRGYQRGRGRGRGNRFPNKPVPQSALIVIQVEGSEDQQPKVMEKSKDSRPFLLRPQDKWASTEGSSQESTPTRQKDTSKFRRYDDETDSEEDEDTGKRRRRDSDTRNFPVNMSLEDVSSDTEIELNKSIKDDFEIEVHNEHHNEVEIHNENQVDIEICNSEDKPEAANEISEMVQAANDQENDNRVFKEVAESDFQSEVKVETSDVNTPSNTLNEVNVSTNINVPLVGESYNNDGDSDTRNVVKNKNIEILGDNTFESDSTPLRDEGTPLQDELRQDDSVSNSYITFSRFNRRNRRDSDTGSEESEEDIDDAVLDSSRSHLGSDGESFNSDDNEVNNDDNAQAANVEMEESDPLPPVTTAKTNEPSQDSRSSLPSSTASKKSSQLLASSSSSSSESASESSSSSSESDSEDSSVSSDSKKKSVTTKLENVEKGAKSEHVRSLKNVDQSRYREKHVSHQEERRISKNRNDDWMYMVSVNHKKSRRKSEEFQDNEKAVRKRSPMYSNDSKSHFDKYNESQIKADPEFDATNYRDDKMCKKSDKRHDKYDRRPVGDHGSQNNSRSGWKRQSNDRTPVDRGKSEKVGGKDRRYFEEISRLKIEEDKDRVRRKYDTSKTSKSRLDEDRKSCKSSIDNGPSVKQRESSGGDSRHSGKRSKEYMRESKSDHHVHDSKTVKSSKSADVVDESTMIRDKQQHKSNDGIRSKKSGSVSKVKSGKDVRKHKSTNDSWKSESSSDSDSDSDRSISSLSDMSSDSETETWRDKKHGAKRKTADIELEKRRRDLKERNRRRESDRSRNRERGNGDGPRNSRYNQRDRKHSSESNRSKSRHEDLRDRNHYQDNSDRKQNSYKKKYNEFHDDKSAAKNFEELSSSDSESGVKKHRGVVSVVKSDRTKVSPEIPSLLKISVTKPKSENASKPKKKSSKAERLIIHVDKSSDDDSKRLQTKTKKKKKKHKKSWSSDEDSEERPQKQIVNITFNEESKPDKSHKSVHDRLGFPAYKRKIRGEVGSGDAGYSKRSIEERQTSSEKRIKLDEGGKYSKYDKNERENEGGGKDSVLNERIQKIKEKNAEILRRKQLVEQDKQIYG